MNPFSVWLRENLHILGDPAVVRPTRDQLAAVALARAAYEAGREATQ